MKRKTKFSFPAKYLLMILSVLCVGTCILSFTNVPFAANLKDVTGYVLIPVQKGLNQVGLWFSNKADNLKELQSVMADSSWRKIRN